MMMRDKASGQVFASEKEAVEWFCHGRSGCEGCPMNAVAPARMCRHDAWEQPFESARAMGMEVVRYRLTDAERERMQDFGARWVSREACGEFPDMPEIVDLWTEKPHLLFNTYFVTGKSDDFSCEGRVATCRPEFFPSVAFQECADVDELVVVEEGDGQ